jgi:dolichol-phosphate mannosyltransferase
VEAAVMHNFAWHVSWTWRDRAVGRTWRAALLRLLKFHLGTGAVAMVMNLLVMRLLVQGLELHYLVAGVAATAIAGLTGFTISNFFVFVAADRPASCRM